MPAETTLTLTLSLTGFIERGGFAYGTLSEQQDERQQGTNAQGEPTWA